MATSVEAALLIFGGIIFLGYIGDIISKRFAVPSALFLLLIGYLLRFTGYADPADLIGIQGIFGSIALIILLFDGGLSMNLYEVIFKSGRVMMMGVLTTVLGMVVGTVLFALFGFHWLIGAIMGAVAGGIGSSTTISIIKGLNMPQKIKNFLTLESSITDIFSIILTIVLTEALISGVLNIQSIGQGIVGQFSIGLFVGIAVGIVAIVLLPRIQKGYNYMLTFAVVLMLFSATEFLNGSGAIAVLVFGLMFGNGAAIRKILMLGNETGEHFEQAFQEEITFFIRTFFFVFLGVVVSLGSWVNFAIALLFMVGLYAVRKISLEYATKGSDFAKHKSLLASINPRGLATAVLATYPLLKAQEALSQNPNYWTTQLIIQLSGLAEISFYLIVLSIVFTTVLVPMVMNSKKKEEALDEIEKEVDGESEGEEGSKKEAGNERENAGEEAPGGSMREPRRQEKEGRKNGKQKKP